MLHFRTMPKRVNTASIQAGAPQAISTNKHGSIITTTNIHKRFGTEKNITHVLKGISITINRGEFIAIMGKSGAGKSTLLYQLSALDTPSEGTIMIDEVTINTLTRKEISAFRLRTLGYVFQDYALIQDLTALENVILPLLMRGIDWDTAENTARAAIQAVRLPQKYDMLPSQLSGGEQQRIAVARAIAGKPKILFADEPTANLDSTSGKALIELFRTLNKEGQTIVMVTHEEEYTKYCDRIITLEDGLIIHETRQRAETQNITVQREEKPYENPLYTTLAAKGSLSGALVTEAIPTAPREPENTARTTITTP